MTVTTHTCSRCADSYECNEWEPTFACPTCERELCGPCHAKVDNAPHLMRCEKAVLADISMRPKDYCCSLCARTAAKAALDKIIGKAFAYQEPDIPTCYLTLLTMLTNYDYLRTL